jgi:uncharacterized protein (DUF58 family)
MRTNRWLGLGGLALVVVGAGVFFRASGLLVAGAVAAGVLAARASAPPRPSLRVERTVEDPTPAPEAEVRVEVTVTNEGGTIYDLRLIDDVPDGLAVVDGPARHATALRPGAAATFAYTVRSSRGDHDWQRLTAIARDPMGAHEIETTIAAETTLRCVPDFESGADLPLRGLTTPYSGRVPTDIGGSGIEFHAVREYRRGDPQARVDWNRAARTGELATLELREERAATVVFVVDTRGPAYAAPAPEAEGAVERGIEATAGLAEALLSNGDRVGATAFSPLDSWLAPGSGTAHRAQLRELLATDPAFGPTPAGADRQFIPRLWRWKFRQRLPADAQVMLVSPCVDEPPIQLAKRFDALGHLVTVISPDPTTEATLGGELVGIERDLRLADLRRGGVRVLDWGPEEPFAVAADRVAGRWSR